MEVVVSLHGPKQQFFIELFSKCMYAYYYTPHITDEPGTYRCFEILSFFNHFIGSTVVFSKTVYA